MGTWCEPGLVGSVVERLFLLFLGWLPLLARFFYVVADFV
jgi:hypothetical protein